MTNSHGRMDDRGDMVPLLNLKINFIAMNCNIPRRGYSDTYLTATNFYHGDLNVVPNFDTLI